MIEQGGNEMIARLWHGTTRPEKADSYLDYLNRTGMPDYRHTVGNLGAYVMRRIENGVAHFFTLTFWDSYEAIKRFAGKDLEQARYYPEDKDFLLEFEPQVQHYELFASSKTVKEYRETRRGLPRWW
jgi:heme-degrading monooxygenase HmoA